MNGQARDFYPGLREHRFTMSTCIGMHLPLSLLRERKSWTSLAVRDMAATYWHKKQILLSV